MTLLNRQIKSECDMGSNYLPKFGSDDFVRIILPHNHRLWLSLGLANNKMRIFTSSTFYKFTVLSNLSNVLQSLLVIQLKLFSCLINIVDGAHIIRSNCKCYLDKKKIQQNLFIFLWMIVWPSATSFGKFLFPLIILFKIKN